MRAFILLFLHLVSAVAAPVAHAIEEAGAPVPVLHLESEDFEGCPTRHAEHACVVCRAITIAGDLPHDHELRVVAPRAVRAVLPTEQAPHRAAELDPSNPPRGPPAA